MKQSQKASDILARIVRVVSIPPVMITALLLLLARTHGELFHTRAEIFFSILTLAVIPALAYPLSYWVPAWRTQGRKKQRALAFYFTLLGYAVSWAYGLIVGCGDGLMLIYASYLLSVLILSVLNRLCHLRASGHACSATGPTLLIGYFIGGAGVLPDAALYAVILWASLRTKRHTLSEFFLGTTTYLAAFVIAWLVYGR